MANMDEEANLLAGTQPVVSTSGATMGMRAKAAIAGLGAFTIITFGLLMDTNSPMSSFTNFSFYFSGRNSHGDRHKVNIERYGNNIQGMDGMHSHCWGNDALSKIHYRVEHREESCWEFFGRHCNYAVRIIAEHSH